MFKAARPGITSFSCVRHCSRRTTQSMATKATKVTSVAADTTPFQLQFYVPKPDTSTVLAAVHKTGAGTYPGGIYGECAFITSGIGTFRPLKGANPTIGKVGDVEKVVEDKVEVMCLGEECLDAAVEALKQAHPYEQVAFFVVKGHRI